MEIKRLFDLLDYRMETCPQTAVFVAKQNGQWKYVSIAEYREKVDLLSYALLEMGMRKGDKLALISANCPEWNYLDMAAQQIGCILVPIYPTISADDYRFILDNAEVRMVFIDNIDLMRRIKHILEFLPRIEAVYSFKPVENFMEAIGEYGVRRGGTLDDLYALGREHPRPEEVRALRDSVGPRDVATMIYTSGTTGFPKGVMLCHENILTCVNGVKMTPKPYFTRAMSFLPLCHIYERMMNYLYQFMGYEIYYAESIAKVVDNLKFAKPYMMTAVPRFVEKMYDGIYRSGQKLTGMKKKIFFWALDLAQEYDLDGTTWWYNCKRRLADKLVFGKIRDNFGGCLEMFVSGGSAIQPRLAKFFTCIGMDIYEGYGLTETSPVIAVSSALPHGRKLGTAGLPLPGIEVKVLPDTGEIVCRGANVMLGYYKAPELTAEVIDKEGWLHTGDTGAFEPEGQLRITGRVKTMFKTSMGKYVNPEVIEEKFKESPFILDMMVVGENQKFAAALILPDFDFLKEWQERHGIHCQTREEMVTDKRTLERYNRVVAKYNPLFGATEQIKRYKIINDTWTEANGTMTPTLKIKRNVIAERHKEDIEALFK